MTSSPHSVSYPEGAEPVRITTSVAFTEGPAVDADGTVYFSDIFNNRIWMRTPDGTCRVFREPSFRTNGQVFDPEGRLHHCEGAEHGPGGGRRVTRTDLVTSEYTVVTDRYDGKRYNSPNDICADGQGRLYFTDPRYGDRSDLEMQEEAVYRIEVNGEITRILTQPAIQKPNGIAVTRDGRVLYVVDSNPVAGGNRKIWSFELDADGNPSIQKLVYDFAPGRGGDGLRLDQKGSLYVAAGIGMPRGDFETTDVRPGVYVIAPDGTLRGRIPVPEDRVTNVAFGGPDGRSLFVTAGKTLFETRVAIPGQVAWPRWKSGP